MALVLSRHHADAIFAHAAAEAPCECCGILAGLVEGQRVLVREVHPVTNVWEGDRSNRFLIDPKAHLRLQHDCRERGLAIVGFYHSHPKASAAPSGFDLDLAWPHASYVIVSLRAGRAHELRSWRFDERSRQFYEEPAELSCEAPPRPQGPVTPAASS